jgi:hypothetical protein
LNDQGECERELMLFKIRRIFNRSACPPCKTLLIFVKVHPVRPSSFL